MPPVSPADTPHAGATETWLRRTFMRLDRLRARLDRGGLAEQPVVCDLGLGPIEALWAAPATHGGELWIAAGAQVQRLAIDPRTRAPRSPSAPAVRLPGRVRALQGGGPKPGALWAATDAGLFELRVATSHHAPEITNIFLNLVDPRPCAALAFDGHTGDLWAGGTEGILTAAATAVEPQATPGAVTGLIIEAGAEPDADLLWIATDLGHLYRVPRGAGGAFAVEASLCGPPWLTAPGSAFKGLSLAGNPPANLGRGVWVRSLRSLRQVAANPAHQPTLARWRPPGDGALTASTQAGDAPGKGSGLAVVATTDAQLWLLGPAADAHRTPAAQPLAASALAGRQWRVALPASARALAWLPDTRQIAVGGADGRLLLHAHLGPAVLAERLDRVLSELVARLPGPALVTALMDDHARDPWSEGRRRTLLAALPAVLAASAPPGWEALVHAAIFPPGPDTDALLYRALGVLRRAIDPARSPLPAVRSQVLRLVSALESMSLAADPSAEGGQGLTEGAVPVRALEALLAGAPAPAPELEHAVQAPADAVRVSWAATLATTGIDASSRRRHRPDAAPGPVRALLAEPGADDDRPLLVTARGLWRTNADSGWTRCPLPVPWGAPVAAVLIPADPEGETRWAVGLLCADGEVRQVPGDALSAPEGPEPAQRHLRGKLASRAATVRGRGPQAAPATALAVDAHRRLLVGDEAGNLGFVAPGQSRQVPALARGLATTAWGEGGAIRGLVPLSWRGPAGRVAGWVVAREQAGAPTEPGRLWALVERPDGLYPVAQVPLDLAGLRLCAWPAAGTGVVVTADARGRVQAWTLGDAGGGWAIHRRWQVALAAPVQALAPLLVQAGEAPDPRLAVAGADERLHLFDRDGWPAGGRATPGLAIHALCPRPAQAADADEGIAVRLWVTDDAGEVVALRLLQRAHFAAQAEALAGPPSEGALLAARGLRLRTGWFRRRSVTASHRFDSDFPESVLSHIEAWQDRGHSDAVATDVVCGLVARLLGPPVAGLRGGLAHLIADDPRASATPAAQRWGRAQAVIGRLWTHWGAPDETARHRVIRETVAALAAALADPATARRWWALAPTGPSLAPLRAGLNHALVAVRLVILKALARGGPALASLRDAAGVPALHHLAALLGEAAARGAPPGASPIDAAALADAEARTLLALVADAALAPLDLAQAVLEGRLPGHWVRDAAVRLWAEHLSAPATRADTARAARILDAAASLDAGLTASTPVAAELVRALVALTEHTGVLEATLLARAAWPLGATSPAVRSGTEPSADATLPYGLAEPIQAAARPPAPEHIRLAHTLADAARLLAVADMDAMQALRIGGGPDPTPFDVFEHMAALAAVYWRAKHEDIEVRPFGALEHPHFAELVAAVNTEPAPDPAPGLVRRLAAAARRRWQAVVAHEREHALLGDFSLTLERTLLAEDRLSADVLDASAAREAAAEDAEWHAAAVRGLFIRLALLGEVRCGLLVYSRPRDEGPPILVRAAIGWPPDPDRGAPWPPGWDDPQAIEHLDADAAVRWLEAWPTLVRAHAEPLRVGAGRQRRTGGLMLFGWDAQGDAGRARYKQQAVVRDLLLDTLSIKSMASAQRAFIGRFFSMVAHNLRNPAFVLRSGLKMLEEGRYALAGPDDLKNKHAELYRHAVHMDGIIDSILQFRQQHLEPDLQPVVVALVVRDVVKAVRRELEGRRITLVYEGWQSLAEVAIHTDHTWLYEIVQNLLNNATKYAPVGSTVQVRLTPRLQARPPRMELTVTDEGPGVPLAERAAIFEMFFRGAHAEATRTQGLGLGLYISRAYVEALGPGARLSVDDNPDGHGARFTVIVPDGATSP